MATFAKSCAFLFLTTFLIQIASAQLQPAAPPRSRKTQVSRVVPLNVNNPANVAVPIYFNSRDYVGPYDPYDPQGIIAAHHRQAKITAKKNSDLVKSYIPPGISKMAKREIIKVAMNEGRRFAVAHPRETAELVGIATKAKNLYDNASHKLKKIQKKAAEEKADS